MVHTLSVLKSKCPFCGLIIVFLDIAPHSHWVTAYFSGLLPFCLSKIVTTKYGDVEGDTLTLVDDFHNGIEIDTYLGIPFARPPVGELRFTVSL